MQALLCRSVVYLSVRFKGVEEVVIVSGKKVRLLAVV